MLIDSHCHLDKLDLTPYETGVDGAIKAAKEAGVSQILTISVDLEGFKDVHQFTRYAGVFASCGVHPLHKEGLLTEPETLETLAQSKKVIAHWCETN